MANSKYLKDLVGCAVRSFHIYFKKNQNPEYESDNVDGVAKHQTNQNDLVLANFPKWAIGIPRPQLMQYIWECVQEIIPDEKTHEMFCEMLLDCVLEFENTQETVFIIVVYLGQFFGLTDSYECEKKLMFTAFTNFKNKGGLESLLLEQINKIFPELSYARASARASEIMSEYKKYVSVSELHDFARECAVHIDYLWRAHMADYDAKKINPEDLKHFIMLGNKLTEIERKVWVQKELNKLSAIGVYEINTKKHIKDIILGYFM